MTLNPNRQYIQYTLPTFIENKGELEEGLEFYNKKKHLPKNYRKYVAHAHFIKGIQVYDTNCKYCIGVIKPKRTPEEQAARNLMKQQYISNFYKQKRREYDSRIKIDDELNWQHLNDI